MNSITTSDYKTLFEINPLPVIMYNRKTLRVKQCNKAALELFGYRKSEIIKLTVDDLFTAGRVPEPEKREQTDSDQAWFIKTKNNRRILVKRKSVNTKFENKLLILETLIPVEFDSEEDEFKALLTSVVDASEDAIIVQTIDGQIINWNKGAEAIYGYRADEVIGNSINIIVPEELKDEIAEILLKLNRGERIIHFETERQTKGGDKIQISKNVYPVKDSKGKMISISTIDRNISGLKKNLELLKEKEIIFRHLIENMAEVFYVSDPRKPEILYMSNAYETVFGQPVSSIYEDPMSYLNYIVKEDVTKAHKAIAKQKKGIATDYTYRINRKNGKVRYLRERAFPVKDKYGIVFRIIGIAEDITERIIADEEIIKSEYRYRSIFESAAISMWEVDYSEVYEMLEVLKTKNIDDYRVYFTDHPELVEEYHNKIKVVDVNPKTIRLFKAETKKNFLKNYHVVRAAESNKMFQDQLIVLANGGNHFEAETEYQTFNGKTIYIYTIISYPGKDSPYQYAVASFIDITERKMAERALSESEQRFRIMADTAPVLIWTAGTEGEFHYFNKPWLDFRGKTIEKEIGYKWEQGIHPDDYSYFIDTYEISFVNRKEFRLEFRLERSDGVYRWLLNHGVPRYSKDGIFRGFIGSAIDITDRKRNEFELSQSLGREQVALFQAEQIQKKLQFLAEASNILNSSLEYTDTIQSLARLLTPAICDWFIVDLTQGDELERLVVYHTDPSKIELAIDLQRKFPSSNKKGTSVSEVINTGKSLLFTELPEEFTKTNIRDTGLFENFRKLGINSVMIVPLTVRENVLGAITLCTAESGRHYTEEDLSFAEDIAYRAAMAIENAKLFQQADKLNKELETRIKEQQHEIKVRKKIERELRESEERFRMITENTNDFISLIDEEDKFLYANPTFTKVLGFEQSQLEGKMSPYDLIHPSDRDKLDERSNQSVVELRYRRTDGEYIWLERSSLKVNYHEKRVTVGISRDITERKKIEGEKIKLYAQLEAQRIRIDNLIANVPGVVWEAIGLPDSPVQTIDFISDYVEKLLGYSVKQWLTTPNFWLQIVHPDDKKRAVDEALAIYRSRKSGISRFRWIAKDGRVIWVEAQSISIFDSDGKIIGMRGVNMDITEQMKYEQQISSSLKEKEILLKEIHHRVKNNMQVISSLLSLQSKYIPDKQTQELFEESRNRIRSMALIHEKLYQSKEFVNIDFQSYVNDLVSNIMISYGFRGRNINLKLEIENISFDIDTAITLGLIINELVSNSYKHAFRGRKNGELFVMIKKEDDCYNLVVKDDGNGIAEDINLKNVDSLGLQLVDTLIRQLYGSFELRNNRGTEAIVMFRDPALKTDDEING
jgi:PAS domain S-box-containing protein